MPAKKANNAVPQDLEALSPEKETLTLSSGTEVKIERLRTRGMFKLFKIVTRGAGPILMQMDLDTESDGFINQLLTIVVMAIPEAEDEALEFIRFMVTPAEYNENASTKAEKAANQELFNNLSNELDDPSPIDTINIISAIVKNEAHDIQALGKQLAALLKTQENFSVVKN